MTTGLETVAHSARIALLFLQDPLLLFLALLLGAFGSLVAWCSEDGLSEEQVGCWKETALWKRAVFLRLVAKHWALRKIYSVLGNKKGSKREQYFFGWKAEGQRRGDDDCCSKREN